MEDHPLVRGIPPSISKGLAKPVLVSWLVRGIRNWRVVTQGNLVLKLPVLSKSAEEAVIAITIGEVPDSLTDIFGGSSKVWAGERERSTRLDFVTFDPGVTFWWTEGTPWGFTCICRLVAVWPSMGPDVP